MTFEDILDKPYCVYGHLVGGELLYIGSGKISRAFENFRKQRNAAWHKIRAGRPVSVRMYGFYDCGKEARRQEYALIRKLSPPSNISGKGSLARRPASPIKIVATNLVTGEVSEHPSIREARAFTGISDGAISSSITGRHRVVKGYVFQRLPVTERPIV